MIINNNVDNSTVGKRRNYHMTKSKLLIISSNKKDIINQKQEQKENIPNIKGKES